MVLIVKSFFWRAALITLTLAMWVSVIAAQEDVEAAAEEASNFSPLVWPILLGGLAAVVFLGFKYSGDATTNSDSN